jgi:hypothetical protein
MMWSRIVIETLLPMTETNETQWKDVDDGRSELGRGFWLKGLGVFLLWVVIAFVVLVFVTRAIYAWGLLIGVGVVVALGLFAAWWKDRREQKAYVETDKADNSLPDHQV